MDTQNHQILSRSYLFFKPTILLKTNMDTQNDGLEKVVPFFNFLAKDALVPDGNAVPLITFCTDFQLDRRTALVTISGKQMKGSSLKPCRSRGQWKRTLPCEPLRHWSIWAISSLSPVQTSEKALPWWHQTWRRVVNCKINHFWYLC